MKKLLFKYVITYLYRKCTGFLIRHQILHISPQGKWDFVKVNKKNHEKNVYKNSKTVLLQKSFREVHTLQDGDAPKVGSLGKAGKKWE